MSLLLDALKRAEQEKQTRHGDRHSEHPSPPPVAANSSLELQPIGGTPAAPASAPQSPALGGASRSEPAQRAQAVFQAKSAPADDSRGRGVLWAMLGAIAVAVIAAGAYVWYSMQSLPTQRPAMAPPRPPPAPVPPPASGLPEIPRGSPPRTPMPEVTPPAAAEPPKAATVAVAAPKPADVLAELLRDAPSPAAAEPVQLARTQEPPRIPEDLTRGYDSLRRGELAAARRSYQAAAAADAASVDAQLGLATVEARSGNRVAAAMHYRRALALDPRNATAVAGLAALMQTARPEALESQLRAELALEPGSAALHLALGSLHASQSRWSEAQTEFFEAHQLDPASADIAYNLAVSLDHLGQRRLAADFYRRALEAARSQPAQFDPAPVARRLAEMGAP